MLNRQFLISARGRGFNQPNVNLLSPLTTTLKLKTGMESGYLALDIDEPNCEGNKLLLRMINRDDFIIRSSRYSLDDVFAGKCGYKVVFKFNFHKDLPKSKKNTQIELFYRKGIYIAIAGMRGEEKSDGYDHGYEYVFSGKPKYLNFDVNDILEYPSKDFKLTDSQVVIKSDKEIEKEKQSVLSDEELSGAEIVVVDEFKLIMDQLHAMEESIINKKNDKLLTFNCQFKKLHKRHKKPAYSFKRDGQYIVRCQGEACSSDIDNLNKEIKSITLDSMKIPEIKNGGFEWDE